MKTKNALKQAELILKLYEIRRETALRTSRDYVGGEFQPKSVDEFVNLVKDGGKAKWAHTAGLRILGHGRRFRGARSAGRVADFRHLPGDVLPVRKDPAVTWRAFAKR